MTDLKRALRDIERIASDPKVKIIGLSEPLRSLACVLTNLATQNAALAAALVRIHFWPGESIKPTELYDQVARIARENML